MGRERRSRPSRRRSWRWRCPATAGAATRLGVFQIWPTLQQCVDGAHALGVDWVRATVALSGEPTSQRVQGLRAAGLGIVLNANTASFPSDLAADRGRLRSAIQAYRPPLLVIENEE